MKTIVLSACLAVIAANSGIAQPELEIRPKEFDFGFVAWNSTLVPQFWFVSTGTDTVRISDIKTGCSCATMPLEKRHLAPGDSMKVGLYWDIGRRVGGVVRGPGVFFEDGSEPVHFLLTGMVISKPDAAQPVSIKPYKAELAHLAGNSIDSVSFTFHNRSDEELDLRVVSYPVDECELDFPTVLAPESSAIGYIKIRPEFADSEFKRSVTVEFSDKKRNRITIPIRRKFY
ncbi:MAG: DUF1573 domain-containing protein [candidate division Zixibacteria bacterium]|nr:DUF1573 domain-containing protein [candidate division Zixibacteria bacterium]